jgi:hypothetical protein
MSSYLELREQNMARNAAMLEALGFVSSATIGKVSPPRKVKSNSRSSAHNSEPIRNDVLPYEERFSQIEMEFPNRKNELKLIGSYLDNNFYSAPALYISGPRGCGKSDICRRIVELHTHTISTYFLCSGYTTAKQMINSLWHAIVTACFARSTSSAKASTHAEELLTKPPGTYHDFAAALRGLIAGSKRLTNLNLILDHVDISNYLENKLCSKLLRLSEFAHAGIKVIAISTKLPVSTQSCIMVTFPSYTSIQVEEILQHILCKGDKDRDNTLQLSVQIVRPVLKEVLPRLLSITMHIGELREALYFVMNKMRNKPQNLIHDSNDTAIGVIKELVHLPSMCMKLGEDEKLRGGNDIANAKRREKEKQRKGGNPFPLDDTIPASWTTVASLNEVVEPSSLRGCSSCADLPKSCKYLIIAAYLASRNPKESDSFVFAMVKKGRRKKTQAGKVDQETQIEAKAPRPFNLERLFSIFSQISIIGETNAIGRKRRRLLTGDEAKNSFDVAETVEQQFGDAQLFAAVNDLEQQRYLVRSSGWSLDNPMYFCCVPGEVANELAALLNFNIGAYLHTSG